MKRTLIVFATLLASCSLLTQTTQAQFEVGISGGYTRNYLKTSAGYRSFTQYHEKSGFVAGLVLQYHFNDWLAIQADPSYIQKNYELRRDHFFEGIYQTSINSYIQLPLMAHFSFGGTKFKGFFNAGGYAAYWASGRVKGAMANVMDPGTGVPDNQQSYNYFQYNNAYRYDEKYSFDSRRDRRMEFGLVAGAGVEYLLHKKFRIFAEARYYYGLSDQQKNYMINQIPRYNDTYVLQAGCLVNFRQLFPAKAKTEAQ
ncbi:porin family protein [Chitinophaga solisilvae]|uniref:porin family protein n=1 Tax=Chitinophaga solisilvae TaxID=1233460 RepID=UPI001367C947|nr:porin family protein [Chitinophaga solisilvae]